MLWHHAAAPWILVLALSLFAIWPALTQPVADFAHDAAAFHLYRSAVYEAAMGDGQLIPRWADVINGGLGGPLFVYYPPLTYMLISGFGYLGMGEPAAWRLLVVVFLLLGSLGAYGLGLHISNSHYGGIAASAVFLYTPALLHDVYERGSPEGFALCVLPWLLWHLLELARAPSARHLVATALSAAALVLLHSPTAAMAAPIVSAHLVCVALFQPRRGFRVVLVALTLGLMLAGFYLLPSVLERSYVHLGEAYSRPFSQPAQNPLEWRQVLAQAQAMDIGLGNNSTGRGQGWLHPICLLAGLVAALWHWKEDRRTALITVLMVGLGLWVLWMQTAGSTWLWEVVPPLTMLQFRWRLLGLLSVSSAAAVAKVVGVLRGRWRMPIAGLAVAVALVSTIPALYPALLPLRARLGEDLTLSDVRALYDRYDVASLTADGELTPVWRTEPFSLAEALRSEHGILVDAPANVVVLNEHRSSNIREVVVAAGSNWDGALYLLYFPGWAAFLDDQPVDIEPRPGTGYVGVHIPAGTHSLRLEYVGTAVQNMGRALCLLGLASLVLLSVFWRYPVSAPSKVASAPLVGLWWAIFSVLVVFVLKVLVVDVHTEWFRRHSRCDALSFGTSTEELIFGKGIRLCGFHLDPDSRVAESVRLAVYWQLDEPVADNLGTFAHLAGIYGSAETGHPVYDQETHQSQVLPFSDWMPGILYRDYYSLSPPERVPAGSTMLELGWIDMDTGQRLPLRWDGSDGTSILALADMLLLPTQPGRIPLGTARRHEVFDGDIRLLGAEVQDGGQSELHISLYWRADGPVDQSLHVFTQLLDDSGRLVAGHDGPPVAGLRPTTSWRPGELVTDYHRIDLPDNLPDGTYTLQTGMYSPATGVRIPVASGEGKPIESDAVKLGALEWN